jgi:tRNA-Thr(GGU) m(6)t(6)A37 methyltransferase TsaA
VTPLKIELCPVGFVRASRSQVVDDFWGEEESCIALTEEYPAESLAGLNEFSHCEVLFFLSQVDPTKIIDGARHPRNNLDWPKVGVFAQRTKNRPNRIGSTICRVVRIEGKNLFVSELDAIDGTPVLDIKPVMREFLPRKEVKQPAWSHELMREYWLARNR